MTGRLDGKVVLLTGVASGMGRVTARLFAQEGATVVGGDIDPEGTAETARLVELDGSHLDTTAPVDLTNRDQVQAWIDAAVQAHGRIDVLYNNASMPALRI